MMENSERLQRYLARAGVASRRESEILIRAGRVRVDGVVALLGSSVRPGQQVALDGVPVVLPEGTRTFMLHKPAGVLCSVGDDRGRKTVMDLLPAVPGLHPVGRLDLDSEGLLLLTNDGDLTLRITHPRFEHAKTYRVWCSQGRVSPEACRRLEAGLELDDGPARARRAEPAPGGAVVVLAEGRKRQLRRMLETVGFRVQRLVRTHIGDLGLGDLKPGAWCEVTPAMLASLGYHPSDAARPQVRAPQPPSPTRARARREEP
jgi:23S rRNA pseudouridine2605 synthase